MTMHTGQSGIQDCLIHWEGHIETLREAAVQLTRRTFEKKKQLLFDASLQTQKY